ncbi:hypothetical protein [Caballeronia sp. GAWG1-1]|uniref:hypothetical protein n=1 Tax=Caballeronia sp. GAWG1-1 TaxID=2921742 RepID=UPI002028BF0F|nr:hypothetical protein [Caballeronia sp. GAWG1-1]
MAAFPNLGSLPLERTSVKTAPSRSSKPLHHRRRSSLRRVNEPRYSRNDYVTIVDLYFDSWPSSAATSMLLGRENEMPVFHKHLYQVVMRVQRIEPFEVHGNHAVRIQERGESRTQVDFLVI